MKVKELMTSSVTSADITTPIEDIAHVMKEQNIGSVPVCDNGKVVGIVTDRDIVTRQIAMNKNVSSAKAREVMTGNIITTSPDTDIHEAAKIMCDSQIRRLPVVENGKLVGILALGDIAVTNILADNAGETLSGISEPSHISY